MEKQTAYLLTELDTKITWEENTTELFCSSLSPKSFARTKLEKNLPNTHTLQRTDTHFQNKKIVGINQLTNSYWQSNFYLN